MITVIRNINSKFISHMHTIETKKTARYTVEGNIQSAKQILYVLHGYGQLAKFFIRKFNSIVSEEIAIVAPEGMHRFYLKGSGGRVGASWMTKEARELDIADNIEFLNSLHKEILKENKHASFSLLGFSQGGATAARWLQYGEIKIEHFILWASVFPPDLEQLTENERFKTTKNSFFLGDEDQYFNLEQRIKTEKDLAGLNLNFDFILFKGDHNIHPAPLSLLVKKLEQ